MAEERYVIGVDGGTESLRAAVFDTTGRILGSAASPYDTQYPQPGWAEQRPEDWWAALGEAVRGAVAAAGVAPESVAAMCVDTTCCTVVALGADGNPLRPALLWMDMRAAQQAARVAAADDPALQVNGGGRGPVSAEWMVPKALWLAEAEPAVWCAAATVCEYQDFINLRLTGRRCCSANNVAVRWHFSAEAGPPLSLLSKVGIPELATKWPHPHAPLPPGALVGGLTPCAAAHLGLPAGLAVAQGGADAFIGMVGLGVLEPGQMALLTGSSHLQLGVTRQPLHGPGFFGTYSDAVLAGRHVIEGGQTSTGSVLAWFRRTCCAPGTSYAELDAEAAAVPPGCEGLTALDHFQGNRTPHTDPLSRGALAGLTLKHGRGHVFRALMEAVAAGTSVILRTMASSGYRPSSITLAGGAARSELWLQIHADMTGLPMRLTRCAEAPMLGCAILAAVCAGLYGSVTDAAAAMVAVQRTVLPDPGAAAAYRPVLRRYAALYPALAPIFRGRHDDTRGSGDAAEAEAEVAEAEAEAEAEAASGKASGDCADASSAGVAGSIGGGSSSVTGGSSDVILAPSLLAADMASLGAAAAAAAAGGAAWLHVDMFDGSWAGCPNWTMGPPVLAALRRACGPAMYLDCHVAARDPGRYVDAVASAGGDGFTFHWEVVAEAAQERAGGGDAGAASGSEPAASEAAAAAAVRSLAARVRAAGLRAGVALAPHTPLPDELVVMAQRGEIDLVLVMTVSPGFGGQAFIPSALGKVTALRRALGEEPAAAAWSGRAPAGAAPTSSGPPHPHPPRVRARIQVDGGVNAATAELAVAAGADVLVAGSFVFGHKQGPAGGMEELRGAVVAATAARQQTA